MQSLSLHRWRWRPPLCEVTKDLEADHTDANPLDSRLPNLLHIVAAESHSRRAVWGDAKLRRPQESANCTGGGSRRQTNAWAHKVPGGYMLCLRQG
jgi:hypothetical protein